jgi:glycerate kinase
MGAAGGMGFAFGAVLGVAPQSGIELMLSIAKFDDIAKDATLVVTGEGRIDRQTVMGKAPAGVLSHAQKLGARCIAIGGCVAWCDELRESGFDAIYAITPEDMPLEVAMRSDMAIANMQAMAKQIILDYNLF